MDFAGPAALRIYGGSTLNLTINGSTSNGSVTLSRLSSASPIRLFNIYSNNGGQTFPTVTLENLNLTGGDAQGGEGAGNGGGAAGMGGAVFNDANLNLTDVTVSGNTASGGAGGTLTLTSGPQYSDGGGGGGLGGVQGATRAAAAPTAGLAPPTGRLEMAAPAGSVAGVEAVAIWPALVLPARGDPVDSAAVQGDPAIHRRILHATARSAATPPKVQVNPITSPHRLVPGSSRIRAP